MKGGLARVWAFALVGACASAEAAQLCDGTPCRISLDFPNGGSIAAVGGATISFGSGGSLVLGEGGSIAVGEGGTVSPAPGDGAVPDMSGGGSVVLGDGGIIQFGVGGSLHSGDDGGISVAEAGTLHVEDVNVAEIESPQNVHLGVTTLTSCPAWVMFGSSGPSGIVEGDTGTPIHFTLQSGSTDAEWENRPHLRAIAQGDLTYDRVESSISEPCGSDESSGGEGSSSGVVACSGPCPEQSSGYSPGYGSIEMTGSVSYTALEPVSAADGGDGGGGAMLPLALALLALAGLRRRR